ncbi:MAG: Hsp70 family protein, partial [Pseudonocardiaceae bacterium]
RLRREEAETRNQAESLVYQTEKFIKDNDDKLPSDVKDKVNAALGEAQEALKGTDTAAIRAAMEKLATESQALGQALYSDQSATSGATAGDGAGPGGPSGAAGSSGAASSSSADDVVDAEIVDEEPGGGKK